MSGYATRSEPDRIAMRNIISAQGVDMRNILLLFAIAVLVSAFLAFAQVEQPLEIKRLDGSTIKSSAVDATVATLMKAAEVPGLGLALFNGGNIAYLKAYGVRDEQKKLPLTVDSVMSGASFTKVVFGYLVLQLADQHTLDLDKPVNQYLPKPLPEYPDYADLASDPRYKQITARMLLSHTGGFANWRWGEDDRKLKIHFEPGSRFAYSGEGIDLLQLVVETITKKSLDELMEERVFQPLGMTRTSMILQDRFDTTMRMATTTTDGRWARRKGKRRMRRVPW